LHYCPHFLGFESHALTSSCEQSFIIKLEVAVASRIFKLWCTLCGVPELKDLQLCVWCFETYRSVQ